MVDESKASEKDQKLASATHSEHVTVRAKQADEEEEEEAPLHKQMHLRLNKVHSFRAANSNVSVTGKLLAVHPHGFAVMQEGHEHATYIPRENVFAVEAAE